MEKQKRKIREYWNDRAHIYDTQYQHGLKSLREKKAWLELLEELIPEKGQKILDVGTGTGFLSLLLAEQGHRCKGIDLSPGMMTEAKEKAEKKGLCITFAQGDAECLDEPDESYDIVINRHILWTMPHPYRAVKEWARVVKPGGKVIVIDGDWFFDTPKNRICVFWGKILTLIMGKGNLFKENHTGADEHLPMTKAKNAKRAPLLLQRAGLQVCVQGAGKVEQAEREGTSLRQRLLNPYHRIVLIGNKAESRLVNKRPV